MSRKSKQKSTVKSLVKSFWKNSWTSFWGWAKIAAGSLIAAFHMLGGVVNDPSVKMAINNLNPPTWIALALAVFGAITLISMAHGSD